MKFPNPHDLKPIPGTEGWERMYPYHFVHAGIRPSVTLEAQNEHDQMWIRGRFLESDLDHGATVVHGHSIAPEPQVRHNRSGSILARMQAGC